MKRFQRAVVAMTLGCVACAAVGTAARPLESVPLRKDGELLFVEMRVNGEGPFWFCVDSGASHTVVDPRVVERAGIERLGAATTTGTGTGAVALERGAATDFAVGSLRLRVEEPWIIDLSGVPIPDWTHGLLGAEFFARFVVEIDPERPAITFFDPAGFAPPAGAAALPLRVEDRRLFVPATVRPNEREAVERWLRIDTASESSVSDELVKKGSEVRGSTLGQGLGQDYRGVSGLLAAVDLGPFTFRRVWGPEAPRPAIGMEIFRRFTATFDAPNGKLYLVPNLHLDEPVPEPPG